MIELARPPRIVSVGTANPPTTYTQQEILDLFRCEDPKIRQFFTASHIRQRHLVLPRPLPDGSVPDEDGAALLDKHLRTSLEIGRDAVERCLAGAAFERQEIGFFVAVTSTGFLCPGLSAYIAQTCALPRNMHRVDVLGMGCNAGVNGLVAAAQFASANPGRPALLLCCEACSAAYVFDDSLRTSVVNSLFGDGAAAVLVVAPAAPKPLEGPELLGFEPFVVHEARDEMRFDFEDGRFSFYLGWEIPYLIGEHIATPVTILLAHFGLKRRDIRHWIVHSGGKKVIDAIKYNIGITEYDVRHTRSILRDYGNMSSASVFFSYQQLLREGIAEPGDLGVLIGMGPGVSIETGLLRW